MFIIEIVVLRANLNKRPCVNVTFLNKSPLLSRGGRLLKQGCLFKKITLTQERLIDRGACLTEGSYSVIYSKLILLFCCVLFFTHCHLVGQFLANCHLLWLVFSGSRFLSDLLSLTAILYLTCYYTLRNVLKYGVFSGPYFPAFRKFLHTLCFIYAFFIAHHCLFPLVSIPCTSLFTSGSIISCDFSLSWFWTVK